MCKDMSRNKREAATAADVRAPGGMLECRTVPQGAKCLRGATRVTSPKVAKTIIDYFFNVSRPRNQSKSLLHALKFDFPSEMGDLDAYLPSYGHFRIF